MLLWKLLCNNVKPIKIDKISTLKYTMHDDICDMSQCNV